MSLTKLNLSSARAALLKKECSSVELTRAFLSRMETHAKLNAYITVCADQALEAAKQSDLRRAGGTIGLLEGLPLGIKDLFCTRGIRTTAASKILENFVPTYESTVTQNLLNDGAIFLGKTNMDEFAMGSTNMTSYFGACINPWKRKTDSKNLVPGGSSGGSVAAVAGRLCLAATASDTGGSIRQPAAFTGLVGIKPTYGLCSRYGMVAFASSLDQAGPVTHTIEDAALMLQSMISYDVQDSTSLQVEKPDYLSGLKADVKGMRIGIVREYMEGLSSTIQAQLDDGMTWLREAGAEIVEISLKATKAALPTYYIIAPAEASSNLSRYDGVRFGYRAPDPKNLDDLYYRSRRDGFGAEVRRRIMLGTYVLSAGYYDAYYNRAQKVRQLIRTDFEEAFSKVDLILTPTTPTTAFALDEIPTDPVELYLNDIFTVTVNLAELPAISVPTHIADNGLPLGLQFIGPKLSEQRLLNAGLVLEQASNFLTKVPSHD